MQKSLHLQELKEKYKLVKHYPGFEKIGYDSVKKIAHSITTKNYKRNSIVYQENEQQAQLYFVRHGEFKMTKKVLPNDQDRFFVYKIHTFEICLLTRGESFGVEYFNSLDALHTFSVVCSSLDGSLYVLDLEIFQQLVGDKMQLHTIFRQPYQQMKDNLYTDRVSKLQILSVQQKMNQPSIQQKKKTQRSISSDNYCEKIDQIIKHNQFKYQKIKTEQDLSDSIVWKMKQLNLTSSQEDLVAKQRDEHNERLQKIKILNYLGYRPKVRLIPHRSIDYKKLLLMN